LKKGTNRPLLYKFSKILQIFWTYLIYTKILYD
jgi:hypothetical protein